MFELTSDGMEELFELVMIWSSDVRYVFVFCLLFFFRPELQIRCSRVERMVKS